MQTPAQTWLGKLANLNVARTAARGAAPHKPLMLLTVIDLIESGDIPDGWVKYDVRLVSRFRDYWELVQDRQRNSPDIPMPFNALGSDKDQIWQCFTTDGQPSKSKLTTRLCHLDPDLFTCLQDVGFRREARTTLVAIYFTPTEQVMLCARLGLPAPKTEAVAALRADAAAFKARQKKGRDSRFKSDVLGGYYFTCALTGYRLDTESTSIVQAAHIHQHAQSGNDDPRNGLALTPDAHWTVRCRTLDCCSQRQSPAHKSRHRAFLRNFALRALTCPIPQAAHSFPRSFQTPPRTRTFGMALPGKVPTLKAFHPPQ